MLASTQSATNPIQLPATTWARIASLLPAHQVLRLAHVHRVFFELAMDKLYARLEFASYDERMTKKLEQMQQCVLSSFHLAIDNLHDPRFPSLARRVKSLYITPAALEAYRRATSAAAAPTLGRVRDSVAPRPRSRSVSFSKTRSFVRQFLTPRPKPEPKSSSTTLHVPSPTRQPSPIEMQIGASVDGDGDDLLLTAISCMTQILEFTITFPEESPSAHVYQDQGTYISLSLTAFAKSLRKLTISGDIHTLDLVCRTGIQLPKLTTLNLHISPHALPALPHDSSVVFNAFSRPFRQDLTELSVSCSNTSTLLLLVRLFGGYFPSLSKFTANTLVGSPNPGVSIVPFIHTHCKTLESLVLGTHLSLSLVLATPSPPLNLPALETLSIDVTEFKHHTDSGRQHPTNLVLFGALPNLRSLTIEGPRSAAFPLNTTEFVSAVATYTLHELSLCEDMLAIELFDAIALHLPRLKSLTVFVTGAAVVSPLFHSFTRL